MSEKPKRRATPLYHLIMELYAPLWSQEYGGEQYQWTAPDRKFGKDYLENLIGELVPDAIISEASFFLRTGGIFAERRHKFCDFIRNIGTFAPPRKEVNVRRDSQTTRATFEHTADDIHRLRDVEETLRRSKG